MFGNVPFSCSNNNHLPLLLVSADAMTRIPYVECAKDGDNSQLDLCKQRGVQVVPTWRIAGENFPGDQDLDELESIIAAKSSSTTTAVAATTATTPAPDQTAPGKERLPALPPAKSTTTTDARHISPPIQSKSTEKALSLAKQLNSLNARMYGAYFCPHCQDQKEEFGKEAFQKVQYVECTPDGQDAQLALCQRKGITSVPTWEVNGKLFVGQRSMKQMQKLVDGELTKSQAVAASSKSSETVSTKELENLLEEMDMVLDDETKAGLEEALQDQQKDDQKKPSADAVVAKIPPPIQAKSSDQAFQVASGLESLDAKLYGAHWCRFTQSQKEKLGKEAFNKIRYVECSRDGLNSATGDCIEKGIDGFPTWVVNGKLYPGDQELEELEGIIKENSRG